MPIATHTFKHIDNGREHYVYDLDADACSPPFGGFRRGKNLADGEPGAYLGSELTEIPWTHTYTGFTGTEYDARPALPEESSYARSVYLPFVIAWRGGSAPSVELVDADQATAKEPGFSETLDRYLVTSCEGGITLEARNHREAMQEYLNNANPDAGFDGAEFHIFGPLGKLGVTDDVIFQIAVDTTYKVTIL